MFLRIGHSKTLNRDLLLPSKSKLKFYVHMHNLSYNMNSRKLVTYSWNNCNAEHCSLSMQELGIWSQKKDRPWNWLVTLFQHPSFERSSPVSIAYGTKALFRDYWARHLFWDFWLLQPVWFYFNIYGVDNEFGPDFCKSETFWPGTCFLLISVLPQIRVHMLRLGQPCFQTTSLSLIF